MNYHLCLRLRRTDKYERLVDLCTITDCTKEKIEQIKEDMDKLQPLELIDVHLGRFHTIWKRNDHFLYRECIITDSRITTLIEKYGDISQNISQGIPFRHFVDLQRCDGDLAEIRIKKTTAHAILLQENCSPWTTPIHWVKYQL